MMARKSTRIRSANPEKATLRAVNDACAIIGLPEAQREAGGLALVDVVQFENEPKTTDKTVRKLTRVDRLQRSGAIDAYQAEAINLYVKRAEAAMGTTVKATTYGQGGGGSTPTGAAAAAHERNLMRTEDIRRFHDMQASVPAPYRKAFDAIVLDNQQMGLVGERQFAGLGKSQASHNLRELIRTCADHIANDWGHLLSAPPSSQRAHLLQTMSRFNRRVAAAPVQPAIVPKSKTPLSDAVEDAIANCHGVVALLVSESVKADLMRENGLRSLPTFAGIEVVVQSSWSFGWIVSRAAQ